jgi:hypothetical protein
VYGNVSPRPLFTDTWLSLPWRRGCGHWPRASRWAAWRQTPIVVVGLVVVWDLDGVDALFFLLGLALLLLFQDAFTV